MTPKFNHLSQDQRCQIEALINAGHSQTYIKDYLHVNKGTISRELKRNSTQTSKQPSKYKAGQAQLFAEKRAYKPYKPKSSNKNI
jgi:IS30 family transposase